MSDLKYVGEGRHLVGIPTLNLTAAEVAVLAEQRGVAAAELRAVLVRSGLYKATPPPKPSALAEK